MYNEELNLYSEQESTYHSLQKVDEIALLQRTSWTNRHILWFRIPKQKPSASSLFLGNALVILRWKKGYSLYSTNVSSFISWFL